MEKKQNVWLDMVRSTAIFLVLIGHLRFFLVDSFPGLQSLKFGGFIGVELFFVLSGFLIGDILYKLSDDFNYKSIKTFYFRRWFRTLPNYYLFLLINIITTISGVESDSLSTLWQYFIFAQNLYLYKSGFFLESWSLSVEEIFYFVFPIISLFIVFASKLKPKLAMLFFAFIIIIVCSAARYNAALIPGIGWQDVRASALLRLDSIMIGVVAAFMINANLKFIENGLLTVAMIALFAFCCYFVAVSPANFLDNSMFAKTILFNLASIGCLGFVLLARNVQFGNLTAKVARFFASISYSAYLSNLTIFALINKFLHIDSIFKAIIYIPITILCSYVVFKTYESLFLNIRDRYFKT